MAIEEIPGGGIVITGEEDINLYRLITLKAALKLHIKGIRVNRRVAVTTILRREFGFRGNAEKQLAQLEAFIEQKGAERAKQSTAEADRIVD